MWEPISEPEASTCPAQYEPTNCEGHQTCPDEAAAAASLRYFFDTVGGEIHLLDPDHLVEAGFLGSGQCGLDGADYRYVGASPGIDVLSYHDYYPASEPFGGDRWNGIQVRIDQAQALDKPIIAGEEGIVAGTAPNCESWAQRAMDMQTKTDDQLQAGVSGVLFWNWVPAPESDCVYDTAPGDPMLGLLVSCPAEAYAYARVADEALDRLRKSRAERKAKSRVRKSPTLSYPWRWPDVW
jgi:hypothetical protein